MIKSLDIVLNFRKTVLSRIEALSPEQLNYIPEGYNNNIIWNIAHMTSVLHALCYRASALPVTLDRRHFIYFLPGTKPGEPIGEEEIAAIKKEFMEAPLQLAADLEKDIFVTYTSPPKIEEEYKIRLESIQDAISYVVFHEGTHVNAILNLRKLLGK